MTELYFTTFNQDQICFIGEQQFAWCESLTEDYRAKMFKIAKLVYIRMSRMILDEVAELFLAEGWTELESHKAEIDDVIVNIASAELDDIMQAA